MIADNSYNKNFRLLSASDFSRLKTNSQNFKSSTFIVYFRSNSDLELNHARLGISVSKKVGKAHERNRFKRLIREKFRLSPMRNLSFDFMVVVHKPYRFKDQTFSLFEESFKKELDYTFNKLASLKL